MPTIHELFTFENAHPRHSSLKEALIVDELGVKPARYYQLLRHAAGTSEGVRLDPLLCGRINRRHAGTGKPPTWTRRGLNLRGISGRLI